MTPWQRQRLVRNFAADFFFSNWWTENQKCCMKVVTVSFPKPGHLHLQCVHETEGYKQKKIQLNLANGCSSSPPVRSPAASLALQLQLALLCAAAACSLAAGLSFFGAGPCQDSP